MSANKEKDLVKKITAAADVIWEVYGVKYRSIIGAEQHSKVSQARRALCLLLTEELGVSKLNTNEAVKTSGQYVKRCKGLYVSEAIKNPKLAELYERARDLLRDKMGEVSK